MFTYYMVVELIEFVHSEHSLNRSPSYFVLSIFISVVITVYVFHEEVQLFSNG